MAIAILNLKGGVGKTHCSWLLAGVAQERGLRILAIDTDPQANLSRSFLPDASPGAGVAALFAGSPEIDPSSLVCKTPFDAIDVLPARGDLGRLDLSDQRDWEREDLHLSLVEAVTALRADYDLIVIDCPPRLSLMSFASLCAADFVVIPLEAADWGAQGVVQVTAAIEYVKRQYNPRLTLLGYLVSRYKRARSYQRSYLAQLRRHFGRSAFDTVIPDLAGFEKSVTHAKPITLFAPASIEAGIARRLFAEIERRIVRAGGRRHPRRRQDLRQPAELAAV